jgi:hypothetical protein
MISIKVPGNQDRIALFELAKLKARESGSRLTGSVASGEFSVPQHGIEGAYRTQGDFLEVTIIKKPWYIPELKIKSELQKLFTQ